MCPFVFQANLESEGIVTNQFCNPDSGNFFRALDSGIITEQDPALRTEKITNRRGRVKKKIQRFRQRRKAAKASGNSQQASRFRKRIKRQRRVRRRLNQLLGFITLCSSGAINQTRIFFDADGMPTIDATTDRGAMYAPVSYTHLTLPTTPYV